MTISYAAARNAPLLEFEDERLLILDWQQAKDRCALEALMLSHARIVFFWARKLSPDKTEQEELVSEGLLGLIRAADMFDLAREVRFSTYARWWVKNSVLTALARLRSVVETPASAKGDAPPIAKQSLDDETVYNFLVSDEPTPEEMVIRNSSLDLMRQRIGEAMSGLDEIDREVVVSRSLKQPPDSIGDLADRLSMSTSKLRQLERRAMSRLKTELMSRGVLTSRAQ
ncbi:sigma-70 family RNA polymerase sigma factor [Sulfitobacter mediterraneus]|uniref:RNA polymerase sigma factor n=2 Tax=Sulfitobacter mediterraneus TaxID=83219 RepID=A0A061SJV1_9RHOB|nr:sigma-70 family RNA polymerase sigma factor [Sulfitobacter mediterraneus]KAJ02006.1 RNA polymerase sigma70 [Sulfitobacter mediterraneus]MBM1312037.1 sigma-70 family RNA polymerase sigma factor [Sulfitobacter mediterraneus]MBM1315917.1 sigma-70 family RNA polymerase sigma factor [Sulfitobacter mediterraneus]MBM1324280.1 sigma-70 family RNA polymerase sigma factor [Sulfitobacter mediterraneus]MBM1328191.1 sigma-70 family RNA polymerase sigma factor [Sulfitobacter mediterraneus]